MKELATVRNDVVGSLLRPAQLKAARQQFDEGALSLERLRQIEDQGIRDAVKLQEEVGLAVVTDGEYRRLNFQDSFGESVTGYDAGKPSLKLYEQRVEGSSPLRRWEIPDQGEQKGTAVAQRRPVLAKLGLARNVPAEEFRFLKQITGKPGKVALIGPDRIAQRFDWQNSTGVYSGLDEFVDDVVKVERADHWRLGRCRMPLCADRRAGLYSLRRSAVARRHAGSRRGSAGKFQPLAKSR